MDNYSISAEFDLLIKSPGLTLHNFDAPVVLSIFYTLSSRRMFVAMLTFGRWA